MIFEKEVTMKSKSVLAFENVICLESTASNMSNILAVYSLYLTVYKTTFIVLTIKSYCFAIYSLCMLLPRQWYREKAYLQAIMVKGL